jgi:hypothetical protein
MTSIARFLIPVFVLLIVSGSQTASNIEVVDTSVSYHTSTITTEQLERIPVTRNVSGALTLAPAEAYTTNLSSDKRITATSQFIDGVEIQVLIRSDNSQPNLEICDLLDTDAICVLKGPIPLSLSPSMQYGGRSTGGVVTVITKSGGTEFTQGRAFNPNASNFKKGKFAFYYEPEKDFPQGAISSAGVSGDGSASFQILNFPGNSYFFFRANNSKFRPIGQFTKNPLGNAGFISSGTLSNRIEDPNNGTDYRFFGYRQYFNVGTQNMKSQVKLQVLNAETFERIGAPFNFTPLLTSRYPIEEQSQSVEIEPGGAFLAFTRYHAASDRNLGYVRGISPTGVPQKQKLFTPVSRMRGTVFGVNALDVIRVTPDFSPEPE